MKKFYALAIASIMAMMIGVGSLETGASWKTFGIFIFSSIVLALAAVLAKIDYDEDDFA